MIKRSTRVQRNHSRGAALTLTVLFFLVVTIAIVLGSMSPVVRDLKNAQTLIKSKYSYYTSDAGIEDAYYRTKEVLQLSSPEVLSLNDGTVSVAVTTVSGTQKEILASGAVGSNDRNVKLVVSAGVGSDFAYGAQVGEGGIVMGSNSSIEGSGGAVGNVYSNGPIMGASGAEVTGDAVVATSAEEDVQAQSTVCNLDQHIARTSPEIDFAQSFRPGDSKPLYKISLYIKKTGNPGSTTMRIVADNGSGVPNTTTLASAALQSSLVTTSYGWVDVTFSSPANLTAGNTYWIVLDDDGANTTNYWTWCKDSNNGFGNGVAKYRASWSSGSAWSAAIAGDLAFKTYLGGGPGVIDNVDVGGVARANTVRNSAITGALYCQTGSSNNKACDTSQADPAPLNMPLSDGNIDQWKNDAAAGTVYNGNCGDSGVAGCTGSGTISIGPAKITGNLTITNGRTLNLTGVVYVQGNINVSNNATVRCDVSFGADSCVILADGYIDASNNAIFRGSGQTGSYILALTTKEGCNGATASGCASGYSGINLGNNLDGAIFYATDSMVNVANNADMKAVVGYKLNISNNATVTYEQGVADTTFSSGPGGGWNVASWKEVE